MLVPLTVAMLGCAPQAVMTISCPTDSISDIVPLSSRNCLWYRPTQDVIRIVIGRTELHTAGMGFIDGWRAVRIALVMDIYAQPDQVGPATGDLTADTLRGMDLTTSGVMYLRGSGGQVDWRQEDDGTLAGSFTATCKAYPHRLRPDDRLAEDYQLTGRFTARYNPQAARDAAQEILWSVE